ncbi:MAG: mannose-1-phosphate guanylyltransferase [Tenacibaculum sp.]
MNSDYFAVIMAGGVGSRFWPVSTQQYPKQFHDMLGTGKSLLQTTFNRISQIIPQKNILIATHKDYKSLVLKQLPKVDKNQILLEPTMKNTAPCILYASLKIQQKNPNALMLVAPSDHLIENKKTFTNNVKFAFDSCREKDYLITLGIKPDTPNTGYGYIQFKSENSSLKKVESFKEKPNLEKAQKLLAQGTSLWNAGIFIWSVKSILKAFAQFLPAMYANLYVKNIYNTNLEKSFIDKNYSLCQNISIDYGVMEQAKNVYVLPVDFGWSDLGTWESLYNKLSKDTTGNAVMGAKTVFIDSKNNILRSSSGKKVIVQGLSDFIIVENDDILLICPKKDGQHIKQIAQKAKQAFES